MFYPARFSVLFVSLYVLTVFFMASCKGNDPEPETSSPYITEVFEYVYAPGQHAQLARSTDVSNFIGQPTGDKGWLYLGGFGGYVVAGFDHDVENGPDADFIVYAFAGASPEPAVVYVMSDTNGDGKPNETWYELKGNQFAATQRNYWMRYYKAASATANITWRDSKGATGELVPGFGPVYSAGWWWPSTPGDSITFGGSRLPDAYVNTSTTETAFWTVPQGSFTRGYAENNHGTDFDSLEGGNKLDISTAVDSLGQNVNLPNIRFIKVQTSVFQIAGMTNEVSAELRGAKDLRK